MAASLAALVACGGAATSSQSGQSNTKYTIRMTSPTSQTDPITQMEMAFAKNVKKASNGRVTITVFPEGQLGSIQSAITQTQQGGIQMGLADLSYFSTFEPGVGIEALPFLFGSTAQVTGVFNGKVGKEMTQAIQTHAGLRVLAYSFGGFTCLFSRVKPIRTVSDMKGLKVRVKPGKTDIAAVQALGAVYSNVAVTDIYTALGQGVLDGGVLTPHFIDANKYYEVAPYVARLDYSAGVYAAYANSKFYSQLPADLQKVISAQLGNSITSYTNSLKTSENQDYSDLTSKGAKVNTVSSSAFGAFRNAEQPVYNESKSSLGKNGQRWLSDVLDYVGKNK